MDAERRLELLEESIALLETAPWRLELARALADYGAALRVARRRSDAHEPLRRAAELADACGARALRARALDGLAALGDRPRKLMFSGAESLTASERRIAELASAGRSNRDIAQDLFVSPKTVENHLGRVYMKLGIKGRRELAAALDLIGVSRRRCRAAVRRSCARRGAPVPLGAPRAGRGGSGPVPSSARRRPWPAPRGGSARDRSARAR